MLIVGLFLFILAAVFFAYDFIKSAWATMTSLGLALTASGLAVYMFYLLDETGKL